MPRKVKKVKIVDHAEGAVLTVEPDSDFLFSVELSLLARSRQYLHKDVYKLSEEIRIALERAAIYAHVDGLHEQGDASWLDWTITKDIAVPSKPKEHKFGLKLISPFFKFSRHHEWMPRMRTVMHILNDHFELTTHHRCGTHIHVVPASGSWRLWQVKHLAVGAMYFERCLDAVMPPYRRSSVWAKSNRHNRWAAGLPMTEIFTRILDDANMGNGKRGLDVEDVATRMNLCSMDSVTGQALGEDNHFQHETFRWNFSNLKNAASVPRRGLGTVEFRQPPGSTTASDLATWIMLTGCFTRLACRLADTIKPWERAETKSLGEWLEYEAECLQLPHKSLLRNLFRDADALPADLRSSPDPTLITFDEDKRMQLKDKDRNFTLMKYRRLLRHL
ncbi:hypothetical protein QBC46DRAFT_395901 [Diplogelasinospora grovesii]|uniref:Amidoligase enzyme n=1 Tax=Diplogelasinospora grovesii TaxID=303347 RepID=A0AAN6N1I7_9PEZI|nr:hypothetical protein QBC46DRAFT_395901 [Diplogelasinospora grovesii]